jgi:hypothetical protein
MEHDDQLVDVNSRAPTIYGKAEFASGNSYFTLGNSWLCLRRLRIFQ